MKKYLVPLLTFLVLFPLIGHTQSTPQTCTVEATYIETLGEYEHDLLRTAIWTNQAQTPLTDDDTLRVNYQMLMSMRHHLEDLRHDLPPCAQEYNTRQIELITAYQDVIGLLIARVADTEESTLLFARIRDAQEHVVEKEVALNDIQAQVTLES